MTREGGETRRRAERVLRKIKFNIPVFRLFQWMYYANQYIGEEEDKLRRERRVQAGKPAEKRTDSSESDSERE